MEPSSPPHSLPWQSHEHWLDVHWLDDERELRADPRWDDDDDDVDAMERAVAERRPLLPLLRRDDDEDDVAVLAVLAPPSRQSSRVLRLYSDCP